MISHSKSLLLVFFVGVALSAACKKDKPADSNTGSGSGTGSVSGSGSSSAGTAAPVVAADAAAAPAMAADAVATPDVIPGMPAELVALDKTIAPILAMKDDEAGAKAACKALDTITTQIQTARKNPPAGIDAAAWTDIAERMAGSLDEFAIECGEGEASDTKALSAAAEIAKEFVALLKKPK
jgi:hypothetical protein